MNYSYRVSLCGDFLIHLPISEFLKRVQLSAVTDELDIHLPVHITVIPVLVVGDEVVLDTTEKRTTVDTWYKSHRIYFVCYDNVDEILFH